MLHAVGDAWLDRQPSVGVARHALAALIALACGIAASAAAAGDLAAKVSPTPLMLIASGHFQGESHSNRVYA